MLAFDAYELRARIAPTLVVCSPFVVPLVYLTIRLSLNAVTASLLGGVVFGILYAFTLVIRYLGKLVEPSLWQSWGGPPTSRMLAGKKPGLSDAQRQMVKERCNICYGIDLSIHEEESALIAKIDEVFLQVRATLRKKDPTGLWFVHNAEYGFWRNLYASIWLWALLGLTTSLLGYLVIPNSLSWGIGIIIQGIVLSGVAVAVRSYIRRKTLPESADRYAQSAWLSFLEATNP